MLAAGMKTPAIALKLRRTVSAVRTRKTVLNKREAGPNPHTQRSHMQSCKRFAAWLQRSPDTATPDEVRRFQLYLVESGMSICNRNRIMTGVRFLFRITLRRHGLEAEVGHIKEPQNLPPVLSPEEVKRVLIMATSLKARTMLSLALGCGLRASEVVRPRAADIDSELIVIRIVQSKPAHSSTMPACCRQRPRPDMPQRRRTSRTGCAWSLDGVRDGHRWFASRPGIWPRSLPRIRREFNHHDALF